MNKVAQNKKDETDNAIIFIYLVVESSLSPQFVLIIFKHTSFMFSCPNNRTIMQTFYFTVHNNAITLNRDHRIM